eukprot:TRINITY_DN14724_c0_g1_i1.p1 TRINITY_DN14724_c0_g1~~TRINITY_DN14724_c0_g1_i1.p1  ORF type:complete len:355 (-),score=-9.78 TRINITY_DN14724_c0_g1_i1:99-1163(-)
MKNVVKKYVGTKPDNKNITLYPSNGHINHNQKSSSHRFLEDLIISHVFPRVLLIGLIWTGLLVCCCIIGSINHFKYWYWWILPSTYLIWYIVSMPLFFRGGMSLEWFRNCSVWKYFGSYFPMSLIKTANLDPSRCYIFGYHPHGLLPYGAIGLTTSAINFNQLYPGIKTRLVSLVVQMYLPIHRELNLISGIVSCSWSSIDYMLSGNAGQGVAVVIAIGGTAETLLSYTDSIKLKLLSRKGFIRLSLKNGADLVPVIGFGQNDIYETRPRDPDTFLAKLVGADKFPVMKGRCSLLLPLRKEMNIVVGSPIYVEKNEAYTKAEVDELHLKYIDALKDLYNRFKDKYGKGIELEIS